MRSEVLLDILLNEGIDDANLKFLFDGTFYRKFNSDVMRVESDPNDGELMNIHLSRDGFYNVLPEGVTHDYRNEYKKTDPVSAYKKRKREEAQAKHFYGPLENELLRFKQQVEANESEFFQNISTHGNADIIRMILGIKEDVPDAIIVKLFALLMQQKSFVSNDINNIKRALASIIGEKVSVTTKNIKLAQNTDIVTNNEEHTLNTTFTLESNNEIFLKKHHFIIGPLHSSSRLLDYICNGSMKKFLAIFFNLFLPYYAQYSYQVNLSSKDEQFDINNEIIYKSRLGISTVL